MDIKTLKRHIWNPTFELIGYVLIETKKTIHNKGKRYGKVAGKLDVIHIDERVNVYKDQSKFIKMFLDAGALEEYNDLSSPAQRLMTAIINRIEYNTEYFYYNANHFIKAADIDERKIRSALVELLKKEWIFFSSEKDKYFINLCYVCIGDRDEMYRKYKAVTR